MERIKSSYLIREFGLNFTFAFLFLALLFSLEGFFRIIELLIRGTFSPVILLEFFAVASAVTLPYVLPVTFLCATISLFSRLAADREIQVFSASGISPRQLVGRLVVFALLGSVLLFYFNFTVLPQARYQRRRIVHQLRLVNPRTLFQARTFIREIPDTTIYVERMGPGQVLENLALFYTDPAGKVNYLRASRSRVRYLESDHLLHFSMEDGVLLVYQKTDPKNLTKLKFSHYDFFLPLPGQHQTSLPRKIGEMTFRQISGGRAGLEEKMEINRRLVFALVPVVFVFLGSAVGLRLKQKTRSFHLGAGAVLSLGFYELLTLGEILAHQTSRPECIWLPVLVSGLGSLFLWK